MTRERTVLATLGYHHRLDGAARSFLNLLVRLPAAGWRPVVAFVGEGPCSEAYRAAGLDVRILDADPGFDRFNKAWLGPRGAAWKLRSIGVGLPQVARQMAQLIREERVSVVHCNESRALFAMGLGPRIAGTPTVLHVRGSLRPLPPLLRSAAQRIPDRLILVGAALEAELEPRFRHKARVVYNSVTVPKPVREPRSARNGRRVRVLTLAAFEPFKGYHHLARAVPQVVERVGAGNVAFRWFGNTVDTEYARHVRGVLAASDATQHVEIRDWIPDVTAELAAADIVVLPTVEDELLDYAGRTVRIRSSEGVPRCLLEAASFGRPAVSTRVGGIPEAVLDGATGLLVPPSNHAALGEAIVRLAGDPELRTRFGRAGRAHVADRFSHDALVQATVELYDELLEQRRAA